MFKKKILDQLPTFLFTIAKLFLLEFFILTFFRLIFYFSFKTIDGSDVNVFIILQAFRIGFEFDMVASTYALLLPLILIILSEIFYHKTLLFSKVAFITTVVIFWLYALVSAADFPYYKQFSSHLNKQAFLWAASPAFVLKLIFGTISYYGYLFLFLVLAAVIYRLVQKIYAQHTQRLNTFSFKTNRILIVAVLFIPFVIAGARGRLSAKTTTHEGLAIVSDNLFINQVALNPNFTLFRSLLFQKVKNYKVPPNIDQSIAFAREYLGISGPYERSVTREQKSDSAFKPYNVVMVCMESMSTYKMGLHGRANLTPNLNTLIKESVFFDNFFSSGIHTFNGLFSTCAGFPSMLTEHALRRYTKKPFTTLGNLLLEKNYETFFYSTHDPYFDNMSGFFTQNGYQNIYSGFNLPKEKTIGVTGVPDHELYDLFFTTVNKRSGAKPFLAYIMTGSDHGPWNIPSGTSFIPTADTEEKRGTQYADWAIGEFIKTAKKQTWYNNTLFVFFGDHGYSIRGTYEMPLSYNNVPLVLHKPDVLKPTTMHHPAYQPDVTSTVAGILNLSFTNNTFGIDLLREQHPFVYFTADDKIGCISNDGYFFYELITQKSKRLKKYMHLDKKNYYNAHISKADYLEKSAKQMLDAAEYFIRTDYFSY